MSWEVSELPFPLGSTACTGMDTIDPLALANLEGMEWIVRDTGQESNRDDQGTQRLRRVRLVKNNSGFALLPKRVVAPSNFGRYVAGYTLNDTDVGYPTDPYLPAAGVADQDHFYIITGGPAIVTSDLAGGAGNVIAVGDQLVAVGGATSGATTAGRVKLADFSGGSTSNQTNIAIALAKTMRNLLGEAGTARTTSNTGSDVLVDVRWR